METTPSYELLPAEVQVTDAILGKGAFGEVRVAKWRNIDVAYKRLHPNTLDDNSIATSSPSRNNGGLTTDSQFDLQSEVAMLSKLRHPNLVLFLGVCQDAVTNKVALVTELLPCSLYDIVEVKRVKFTLPDILDIALDIANGLDYLHRHSPTIVHRDISAKNILIGGNRAKIADLGQAKLFNPSVLSRQTGMPGAMAYSAPEVLTGKYSAKIDIFSFGILLCQMCTGEYPRIDRREDQITRAHENYPILQNIIVKSVHYQPHERPESFQICAELSGIRDNDRFYPVRRRTSPEKDVGILALHWMHEEISTQYNHLNLKLEQTTKQLAAEEKRVLAEAVKVDEVLTKLEDSNNRNKYLQDRLAEFEASNQYLQQEKQQHCGQIDDLKEQLKVLASELRRSQQKQQAAEGQLATKTIDLQTSQQQLQECKNMLERQEAIIKDFRQTDSEHTHKQSILQRQLNMQVDYGRELESRLEQTLDRWKQEKETYNQEKLNLKKINHQMSSILIVKEQLEQDLHMCEIRLRQYEGMPMPDEIKARFEDMQRDHDVLRTNYQLLMQEKERLIECNQTLESTIADKERAIQDMTENIRNKDSSLVLRELEINKCQEEIHKLEKEKVERSNTMATLQEEHQVLQDSFKKLVNSMDSLRIELATEKKAHNALINKVKKYQEEARQSQSEVSVSNTTVEKALNLLEKDPESVVAEDPAQTINASTEESSSGQSTEIAVKHLIDRTAGKSGVQGLVDLLLTYTHDERILWRAARSLRELILHDEENRKRCLETAPDQWLVNLLPNHLKNNMIQGQVARLLGTLSFGNDTFRRRSGERGVMTFLCDTLRVHVKDETVMLHVSTAITNLTHGSKENRSRFEESGGIPLIISAMQQNQQSAKLQRQCCWALLTLSGSDDVAKTISSFDGDVAIMQAMTTHSLDGGIQQYGCWSLANLALASEDIAAKLKDQGIIELCQIALENHSQDIEVLRQAKNALGVYAPYLSSTQAAASTKSNPSSSTKTKKKAQLTGVGALMIASSPYQPSGTAPTLKPPPHK